MLSAKLSLLVLLALFVVIILVYLHQSVNHGNLPVRGSSARVALQKATHGDNKDTNTCAHDFGWKFFEDWHSRSVSVVEGVSNVTCARNNRGSSFCKVRNLQPRKELTQSNLYDLTVIISVFDVAVPKRQGGFFQDAHTLSISLL